MESFRSILIQELKRRQEKNPNYSLRAFSRFLKISPSHLSHLINGKRNLTAKQVHKIAESLNLSKFEVQRILNSNLEQFDPAKEQNHLLQEDEFSLISDWYHLAILSLAKLKKNRASKDWIANHLGITQIQALDALERLFRLNLIEVRRGRLHRKSKNLTTSTEIPSLAIRRYHRQNLDLAKEKLETIPVELREFCSMTMPVDLSNLREAKKKILEFRKIITADLEKGAPTEVYTLAIQLFPITKTGEEK